jgi:endonuclease/exonuclease/phosphatase family metal-dependent hydrolase
MESEAKPRKRRMWRRATLGLIACLALGVGLFVWNGLVLAAGERPVIGTVSANVVTAGAKTQVKVFAWNLAKCFVHQGGMSFASTAEVETRLRSIANVIREQNPDVVFLSEVVTECTMCDVDQVAFLARETGMTHWAFGENFNFGLPFFRIIGGNAILCRSPLRPVANPDLAGRRAFYYTFNNRRVLWCRAAFEGTDVLLGAIHTDSFDLENNLAQTEQILAYAASQPTILAGDFNARPTDPSLAAVRDSHRFAGAIDGPLTFPADTPDRRIDYIFAPKTWTLLDSRVLPGLASDHRAVVSTFRVPR